MVSIKRKFAKIFKFARSVTKKPQGVAAWLGLLERERGGVVVPSRRPATTRELGKNLQ